eukprot:366342-Chlamydomonas_euryale.AAC.3
MPHGGSEHGAWAHRSKSYAEGKSRGRGRIDPRAMRRERAEGVGASIQELCGGKEQRAWAHRQTCRLERGHQPL